MKTLQIGWAVTVAGVGIVALSASSACNQPRPKCTTGHGQFAASYTTTSTDPKCQLKGEILGIASYNGEGPNGAPNLDSIGMAIQSKTMAQYSDRALKADPTLKTVGQVYTFGQFRSSEPDDNDFCYVDVKSAAEITFKDLPAVAQPTTTDDSGATVPKPDAFGDPLLAQPLVPAGTVRYDWSALKFYVTAYATGTQFSGNLTRTEGGVACPYSVVALFPEVPCGTVNPDGTHGPAPSDVQCTANGVAETYAQTAGTVEGQSINPDYATKCDPTLLRCVPATRTIPSMH